VGALLVLAACSKDKEIDQPAPLPVFNATVRVDKVWSASVPDKGGKKLRLGLGLAVDGNRVFAAGHGGEVEAFDLNTGRSLWRTKTKAPLSGGPGAGSGLVVVGSSQGEGIALDTATGTIRWRVRLNGEVLSAPAISERVVAVRTVDGKLRGLSPKDGHELWSQEEQVPRLSLRGTAWPVLTGDLVLCGFDNGKVAAVNVNDGTIQWETTIAPPHGRTELERLDDIDGAVRVSGADVYAVGFQGRVAMLALDTGQIWWSHDASSYRSLGVDDESLYMASADGEIIALRRRTGTELWRQKSLLHRRLASAVEGDSAIVTADYQGYVHWLDKATGSLAARASTGKVRVSNPPVVVGNMVLVVNDAGRISAFRTASKGGAKPTVTAPAQAAPPEPAGPIAPVPQGAEIPPEDHSSSAPPQSSVPETPAPAGPATVAPPAEPAPSQTSPTEPTSPESKPTTPVAPPTPPATPAPPLPSQPTPDPVPPAPQTKPQPPPT
jgi:outer membrane protein assembly factor BamB